MNTDELKDKIRSQLTQLGVKEGDTLLVRADLGAIGKLSRNRLDYVDVILDVLGEKGTLVGLAFTGSDYIKRTKNFVFDGSNQSNSGAFANIMLSHPKAIRSRHPTNSFVAIGKNADAILSGHDENAGSYEPMRKLIELNGKMVVIGCVASSPGFTTTHLAESDLGLYRRVIFPTLNTRYYKTKDGDIRLFKRKDPSLCSSSFDKFYSYYVTNEILQQGYVGNAYSILADCKKTYDIEYDILKRNPKFNICNQPFCTGCRARRWDNLQGAPLFYLKKIYRKIISKLK